LIKPEKYKKIKFTENIEKNSSTPNTEMEQGKLRVTPVGRI